MTRREHYFSFATPTFRFLHRQTLEEAMAAVLREQEIRVAERACVLMLWAQALLYRDEANIGQSAADQRSIFYFEQARTLLENEPGPAQLASVEARLAACLYLLSTSRVHTCRFLFAFTHTLVITLALHRKTSKRYESTSLVSERRRRAFWSFYIIDGYLSVLLGQPRHIRDEDIDQPYPANIDDRVLHTSTDLSKVPHHGNLEALVNHAKLARILAQTNDLLYPIEQLSRDDIIHRAESMTTALNELEEQLPAFLQSRFEASLGTQTWERQNSVLGLAIAHARIIATRRTILLDSSSKESVDVTIPARHENCVHVCLSAICTMLDHVYPMMQHGKLRRGFWLTQYVTMCAISTLFVYKLQRNRGRMLYGQNMDLELYFGRANDVQEHMAFIAAAGSTAKRHHALFARLKQQTRENSQTTSARRRAPDAQQASPQQSVSFTEVPDTGNADEFYVSSSLPEQFTPGSMFDTAFTDASSWQYLDQMLPDGFDLSLTVG
jgi:hypothetical protein